MHTKLSKFWLVAILEQENIPLKISPMIFTFWLKSHNAKNVHFPGSFLSSYMYNVLHTCSKQYVSLDNQ